jgi:membrane fusion protein
MSSRVPLFRAEALSAATQREFGSPLRSMPIAWSLLAAGLMVAAATAITFLSLATFYRKETTAGVLNYRDGARHVYAPKGGRVARVFVQEGGLVRSDSPLVRISTSFSTEEGETLEQQQLKALNKRFAALDQRMSALREADAAQRTLLEQRLEGFRRQIGVLRPVRDLVQKRVEIADAALAGIRDGVARGIFPADLFRQRNSDQLEQQRRMIELLAQLVQLESQAGETEAAIAKLPSDLAQQLADIRAELAQTDHQRVQIAAQEGFLIKSPAAGRVSNLQAVDGQQVDAALPLMTIAPEGLTLQADLFVPSRAIGFVKPGQKVRLYFDSFPHERFGVGEAIIRSVASGVLRPEELQASVKMNEPVYRVTLDLSRNEIAAYGQAIPLRAGMSFTADIILEKRSIISLVLDPLLASGQRIVSIGP